MHEYELKEKQAKAIKKLDCALRQYTKALQELKETGFSINLLDK